MRAEDKRFKINDPKIAKRKKPSKDIRIGQNTYIERENPNGGFPREYVKMSDGSKILTRRLPDREPLIDKTPMSKRDPGTFLPKSAMGKRKDPISFKSLKAAALRRLNPRMRWDDDRVDTSNVEVRGDETKKILLSGQYRIGLHKKR